MRLQDTLAQLRSRLGHPLPWVSVAAFGGLFGLYGTGALKGGHSGPSAWVVGCGGPLVCAMGYGFFAPMPWQWSGDSKPQASLGRGVVQASAFALLFCLAVDFLDRALYWGLMRTDRGPNFGTLRLFPYVFQAPFLVLVGRFITLAERGDAEKRQAEARLREAQWVLLRAQLSPHVLFNTLNALAELARRDPEATERAMLDLSELYERMMHHGEQLLAPLAKERQLLDRYLALQALRLGARLRVDWAWDPGVDAIQVPPLLLQPLVENALKHGIAPHPGPGDLRILARRLEGGVFLEVRNTGRPPSTPRPGATGLRNLEDRLALAYGGRARFHLEREGEWTLARLELPVAAWAL